MGKVHFGIKRILIEFTHEVPSLCVLLIAKTNKSMCIQKESSRGERSVG
jgi:hypothetical protein